MRIQAIAYSSGPLRRTIHRYKYQGAWGWSLIFGRLLVGWLEQNAVDHPPDLIVANPTYVGPDGSDFAHTEAVLAAAEGEDTLGRWHFDVRDPPAIIKVRDTPKSASSSAASKRAVAGELRNALVIPNAARTDGKRILVYDDICTTGSQLNVVAECLLDEGHATYVEGVALARAPWRARTAPSS